MNNQTDGLNKMHCQDLQDWFIMILECGLKKVPVLVEFLLNYTRTLMVDWIRGPQHSKKYVLFWTTAGKDSTNSFDAK